MPRRVIINSFIFVALRSIVHGSLTLRGLLVLRVGRWRGWYFAERGIWFRTVSQLFCPRLWTLNSSPAPAEQWFLIPTHKWTQKDLVQMRIYFYKLISSVITLREQSWLPPWMYVGWQKAKQFITQRMKRRKLLYNLLLNSVPFPRIHIISRGRRKKKNQCEVKPPIRKKPTEESVQVIQPTNEWHWTINTFTPTTIPSSSLPPVVLGRQESKQENPVLPIPPGYPISSKLPQEQICPNFLSAPPPLQPPLSSIIRDFSLFSFYYPTSSSLS